MHRCVIFRITFATKTTKRHTEQNGIFRATRSRQKQHRNDAGRIQRLDTSSQGHDLAHLFRLSTRQRLEHGRLRPGSNHQPMAEFQKFRGAQLRKDMGVARSEVRKRSPSKRKTPTKRTTTTRTTTAASNCNNLSMRCPKKAAPSSAPSSTASPTRKSPK